MQAARHRQLISAAQTVTRRTDPRRVRVLRRRLAELAARRPDVGAAAASYYLNLGTVPRPLWSE